MELLEVTDIGDLDLLDDAKFYTDDHKKWYDDDIKHAKSDLLGENKYYYDFIKGLKIKVNSETVGFMWYARYTDDKKIWHAGIFIGEPFKRRKYGTNAIIQLLKTIIPRKETLVVYDKSDNIVAQKFMKSIGFKYYRNGNGYDWYQIKYKPKYNIAFKKPMTISG